MCGLVGSYQYSGNFNITPEYLVKMRDSMVHRGPDGSGIWISETKKIGLAHRRLSIIDLSILPEVFIAIFPIEIPSLSNSPFIPSIDEINFDID